MSTRCALMPSRPSSNTAKSPTGPAPTMRTSVLMVSLIMQVSVRPLVFHFLSLIPAKAGIQEHQAKPENLALDPGFRGDKRCVSPARAKTSRNPLLIQCGRTAARPRRICSHATIGNFDQPQEFCHVLLRAAAAGRQGHIGLGVKRLAAAQNRHEVFHGP